MLPEVGGQIGNTDAVVIVSLALPEGPCRRIMARDPQSGALQLVGGRRWKSKERKGRYDGGGSARDDAEGAESGH